MARTVGSVKNTLVEKSREAMMEAVQIYNNPQVSFKTESFIVLSNIAWMYLMHAYYRFIDIDYRYYTMVKVRKKYDRTKSGKYKYWELERCINDDKSPLDKQTSANLRLLISIRHEIEHHFSSNIDEAMRGKIQASCINYNYYIKKLFGEVYGIDKELVFTVQFSSVSPEQIEVISDGEKLPKNLRNFITKFESELTDEEISGPRYEYRIAYVPYCSSRKSDCNEVKKFVKWDGKSDVDNVIHFKEVEKHKTFPKAIVQQMKDEGYSKFNMSNFTALCRKKNAWGNPQYSVHIGRWAWYDPWIDVVRKHCSDNKDRYS